MVDGLGLTGFNGAGFNKEVQIRKVKPGVTLDQIKAATKDNNLDEVVIKDKKGGMYIAFADEMSSQGKPIETLNTRNLKNVLYVDNETNEDTGIMSFFGEDEGDPSKINKISDPSNNRDLIS